MLENLGALSLGAISLRELVVLFPVVAVLSASVAGIALQECSSLCDRAIGIGNRRFASSSSVGRTWLSATEQIGAKSIGSNRKWKEVLKATVPAPFFATIFPGSLTSKLIVAAAVAVVQTAWYCAVAEYEIARAIAAVALKIRSAGVADTYANQGMASGAILPFTSALGALCGASTAAAMEILPLLPTVPLQALIAGFFPAGAAVFAAAASVSKNRCEVNAEAAKSAAEQIAFPEQSFSANEESNDKYGVLVPVKGVLELIRLTVTSVYSSGSTIARNLIRKWRQRWFPSNDLVG